MHVSWCTQLLYYEHAAQVLVGLEDLLTAGRNNSSSIFSFAITWEKQCLFGCSASGSHAGCKATS